MRPLPVPRPWPEPGLWLRHRRVRTTAGPPRGSGWALWSRAPAAPRQPPTTKAATILGMRKECTITWAAGSPPSVNNTLARVATPRLAVPRAIPAMQPASRATPIAARTRTGEAPIESLPPARPWPRPLPRCGGPDCAGKWRGRVHGSGR